MNIEPMGYSDERKEKILEASRALLFMQEFEALKTQRQSTLDRVGENAHPLTIALIEDIFYDEKEKLFKKWGVRDVQQNGYKGYERLRQVSEIKPVQERVEPTIREPVKEIVKEIQKPLTAQQASDLYLTYDEWKSGLTKAPDWVYDKGMANKPEER